ncbi:MAG TPA: BtpA/SgcQ family protein [Polyangiaceae bacterium]|nr:BtpA/SgcQ family protein [Polyangiaceae bacterium]
MAHPAVVELFGRPRALIGMIHAGALPGTAHARDPLEAIVSRAVDEARLYRDAGFTALLLENMHDRPYLAGSVGPEIVAAMTAIAREVRREVRLPLGVQVLAAANREALAVALASGASFVRVEGFAFAHVADEGLIEACAGPLLRYRRAVGAEHLRVFADIKKKHSSHSITADVSLLETAHAAEFFSADGVIVTGTATGAPALPSDVDAVAGGCPLPVLVGSGITPENLRLYASAHGFIVGSSVKRGGRWQNDVDPAACAALARAFEALPPG